ncbi:MAG TPA: preprotein translocase subunit YajC [Gaiellaceae bacterium]|nr:preprotein translocase subunit YajC [Gaiellaceae bacterium]
MTIVAATTTTASHGSSGGSFVFLIIIVAFVLLWLIVVRPQRKRQNVQKQMLSDLRVGDDVLTAGGLYGRVTGIEDDEVRVEIAPSTEVRVARRAIGAILTERDEHEHDASADEPEDKDDERWQSAFGEGSDAEKPG